MTKTETEQTIMNGWKITKYLSRLVTDDPSSEYTHYGARPIDISYNDVSFGTDSYAETLYTCEHQSPQERRAEKQALWKKTQEEWQHKESEKNKLRAERKSKRQSKLTTDADRLMCCLQREEIEGRPATEKNDCTVVATMVAMNISYAEAHAKLQAVGRKNRHGIRFTTEAKQLGFVAPRIPVGSWGTVKKMVETLPKGNYVFLVSQHAIGVQNGKVVDTAIKVLNKRVNEVWQYLSA